MRRAAMATGLRTASQKPLDGVALYFSAFPRIIDNVKTNRGGINASSCYQSGPAGCVSPAERADRRWR